MVQVAPIGLQYNPRTLWFDPAGVEVKNGDAVVVRTERGVEFGHMVDDIIEVDQAAVKKLRSPLKPVLRVATEKDIEQAAEMERLGREALPVFREMAAETNEDMHPVMVEYLLDGDKAIFYFSAEERVDFRELVRRLAAHFHVRVDMRQIGVRDEARMVGGLGHCGQELCCKRLGGEFNPVSIRMAKEQDLSLNPSKISGVCGRLMCCLRYEFEAYKDFKSRAPKVGAMIDTPDGPAKVVELNVPKEVVSLKGEDGKVVKVALEDFLPAEEGTRPTAVDEEAFRRAQEPEIASGPSLVTFATPHFTGQDKLSDGSVHVSGRRGSGKGSAERSRRGGSSKADSTASRRPRRRKSAAQGAQDKAPQKTATSHRSRRNRSTHVTTAKPQQLAAQGQSTPKQRPGQGQKAAVRPGQRSSGLRDAEQRRKRKSAEGQAAPGASREGRPDRGGRGGERKPQNAGALQNGKPQGAGQQGKPQGSGPQHAAGASQRGGKPRGEHAQRPDQRSGGESHRTARRRSHKAGGTGASGETPKTGE